MLVTLRRLIPVLAWMMLAAACSDDGGGDSGGSTTPEPDGDSTLVYVDYGGLHNEGMLDVFFDEFAAARGITIVSDTLDYAKVESMVDSGNVTWDLTNFEIFFVEKNCGTLFEPLDYDVIDTSGLDERFFGECWISPWSYGEILAYNTQLVKEPPTSWADFYDTQAFPGKRGMYDVGGLGQELETAELAAGTSPDETVPIDFELAFEQLDKIRDDLVFQTFGSEQIQQVVAGETPMALVSTSRALDAQRLGQPIQVVWETQFVGRDSFAIPKGAPNKDLAMELLNEFLVPQKNLAYGRQTLFGPNVTEVQDAVEQDPALCALILTCPPNITTTTVEIDENYYGENQDEIVEEFTAWKEQG